MSTTALILIDMQNDFLHGNGAFPRRHVDAHQLANAVRLLDQAAASQGWEEVPRRVALQGILGPSGEEPLYRHPADEQPTLVPWTPDPRRSARRGRAPAPPVPGGEPGPPVRRGQLPSRVPDPELPGMAGGRVRTIFYVNGSISSWRVQLALHEKALAFDGRRMRVMSTPRPTRQPEFLALSPRGKAPVLIDEDGSCVNESLAILTWLELRHPEPSLLPGGRQARTRARTGCAQALEQLLHPRRA
ncbi:glutathione S-transferase N-terminal domain-containing protein [Sorangium sp. So ce136]|uniref:glutathione S-transferase family protein n=1 Tax=Sorangium sp. So ce136 TaxID=3133284 RepID=UPI003F0FB653